MTFSHKCLMRLNKKQLYIFDFTPDFFHFPVSREKSIGLIVLLNKKVLFVGFCAVSKFAGLEN